MSRAAWSATSSRGNRRCILDHRDFVTKFSGITNSDLHARMRDEPDDDELLDAVLLELQIQIRAADAPGGGLERQAIRQLSAFADDKSSNRSSIRVCGRYAAGAEVQEKEPAGRGRVFRLCVYRCGSYRAHVTNLLANVSPCSSSSARPNAGRYRPKFNSKSLGTP